MKSLAIIMVTYISIYILGGGLGLTGAQDDSGDGGGGQNPFPIPLIPLPNNNKGGGGGGGQNPGFQLPPLPPLPSMGGSPEQQKCFESFTKDGMGLPCLQDLGTSFQTQKISLSATCCSFLQNIDASCKPVVHFSNPFFQALIQQHCNKQGGSADAGSGGTAPAFSDQTGAAGGPGSGPSAGGPSTSS